MSLPAAPPPVRGVWIGLARVAGRLVGIATLPVRAPLAVAAGSGHRGRAASGPSVAVARIVGDGPRIAVFVPPPGSGPGVWEPGRDATGATYPERLRDLLGWSTVELAVAATDVRDGSLALAAALQRLVERWPVAPERIVLVGYAAGGLLARGAVGVRGCAPEAWTDLLSAVVCLGTPSYAVSDPALIGPVGRLLDQQLSGIVALDDRAFDVPPVPGVDYLLVTNAALSRPNRVGRLLGELLWWRHRAPLRARETRDLFPTAERYEVPLGGASLANHPGVHSVLLERLA